MEKSSKARSSESKAAKPKRPRAKVARAATPKSSPRKRAKAVASTDELPLVAADTVVAVAEPVTPVKNEAIDTSRDGRESDSGREAREVFVPDNLSRETKPSDREQPPSTTEPDRGANEGSSSPVAPVESNARGVSAEPDLPAPSGGDVGSGAESPPDNGHRQPPNFQNREFRGRDYWKQLKKEKRNKHGKPWQQNPNDRGPQNPAQPPPPSLAPKLGDLPDPARFADLAALDLLAAELSAGGGGETVFLDALYAMSLADLAAFARGTGADIEGQQPRRVLLTEIFKAVSGKKRPIRDRGFLDLTDKGHGFVVHPNVSYRLYPESTYVPETLVKRYGLKRGHALEVIVQAPVGEDRCPAAVGIERVMNGAPQDANNVTPFEELVPYYPLQRILLEAPDVQKDISMRTVDLLTPVGFGQRVAPPRTGKTVLLQNIANSVSENFPDVKLILLLIDERPEEVTDFKRHTKGEVVSSTFDESPESHVHCAEMV
ncbi:MAG TPA: transcription termination factor Rho, partial [Opitutaceae bacterium]|nr:transcription termination factor Rho [Opitutaceae bacterium]